MDARAFIADASISAFAALGAIVVLRALGRLANDPAMAVRFRFSLWVVIVLMIARIGHWGQIGWAFSLITSAVAALLPLAGLVLAEGLLRRHAPRGLKWFCASGAVFFGLASILTWGQLGSWLTWGLLAFQVLGFGGIAWIVWIRERTTLAPSENQAIGRIALSLVLILPFLVTDFLRVPSVDVSVRLGGVAVLALCWLSITFQRPGLTKADIVRAFAAVTGMSLTLTALLALATPLDLRSGVQVAAVLAAGFMFLATWQASVALDIEDGPVAAMRAIAGLNGSLTGPEAGLDFLRRAASTPDAILVEQADVPDLDADALRLAFAEAAHRHSNTTTDTEQLEWLLASYGATHAVLLTEHPLRIALLNKPGIATADIDGSSIEAVARVARMISTEAHG